MKKNIASMILGILYGFSLFVFAYIYLVLGTIIAISGNGIVAYFMYIFAGLGIFSIITSAFAKKKIIVTRLGLLISILASIVMHAYALTQISKSSAEISLFIIVAIFVSLILGGIALLFSLLAKKKNQEVERQEQ